MYPSKYNLWDDGIGTFGTRIAKALSLEREQNATKVQSGKGASDEDKTGEDWAREAESLFGRFEWATKNPFLLKMVDGLKLRGK